MEIQQIPIERIKPPKEEQRTVITKELLEELQDSIQKHGIMVPLKVRPDGDHYEIIYGHRRYLAAQAVGLTHLPCLISHCTEHEAFIERLHENIHREDLDPIDQADLIHKLWSERGYTYQRIAEIFGKTENWARDMHRVHWADEEIREAVRAGHIKKSHAFMLMKHKDKERRLHFLRLCIENGASPRTLDLWIRDDLGTLQFAKATEPVQKLTEMKGEVHKIMLKCAICDQMVPSDAMYVMHTCQACYDTLWKQKQEGA